MRDHVAADIYEEGPVRLQEPGDAVDDPSLRDASEIETRPRRQPDGALLEVEDDVPERGARGSCRVPGGPGSGYDLREGAVVSGGLESRENKRIEHAARLAPEGHGQREQLEQLGRDGDGSARARGEEADLALGPEPAETGFVLLDPPPEPVTDVRRDRGVHQRLRAEGAELNRVEPDVLFDHVRTDDSLAKRDWAPMRTR